jgi:hypothetical protein
MREVNLDQILKIEGEEGIAETRPSWQRYKASGGVLGLDIDKRTRILVAEPRGTISVQVTCEHVRRHSALRLS